MGTYRIFLAHAKNADDAAIETLVQECTAAAKERLGPQAAAITTIVVTAARDDFNSRMAASGGWDGWAQSVAGGTDAFGEPIFQAIVIPFVKGGLVGKATGAIAAGAEKLGKPVRALFGSKLYNIADIQVEKAGFNPIYRMVVPGLS